MWTEFVSADGLVSKGRDALKDNLIYSEKERPIVAQLFSANPIKMREASCYVALLGFDGININMGCPDRSIEKQGAGASLMKNEKLAGEIIKAVKDGIDDAKKLSRASMDTARHANQQVRKLGNSAESKLRKYVSVSVKTRIGYNKNQIKEWIPFLLKQDIDILIVHARTRKEMSLVPARWEHIKEVVEIRNKMKVKTKIVGNGDVRDINHGRELAKETGCDGIMIGRGVFGNPWIFSQREKIPTTKQKLKVMLEHTKLFEKLLGKTRNFYVMKKHYKAYVNGFNGAKELRVKLMETNSYKEAEIIVRDFLRQK